MKIFQRDQDLSGFKTFVNQLETDEEVLARAPTTLDAYPQNISFENRLVETHDYFQTGVECDLVGANDVVLPWPADFYITNDDGLFYHIQSQVPITRLKLAYEILNWLMISNAYYSVKFYRNHSRDIPATPIGDYASNFSVHGLTLSKFDHNGQCVYNLNISS